MMSPRPDYWLTTEPLSIYFPGQTFIPGFNNDLAPTVQPSRALPFINGGLMLDMVIRS